LPRHGTLSAFLDEVRAAPKVQAAIAAGKIIEGTSYGVRLEAKPAAEYLAGLERVFEWAERDDSPVIVEIHDRLCEIVSRDAPIKERLLALLACLKAYDPKPLAQ
jgi:hypothetical protein